MDYRVIKENDLFLLTDLSGNISEHNRGHGLYTKDTRFLSRLALKINGTYPNLLESEADQNFISEIVLTNTATQVDGKVLLWPEALEIVRTRFIYEDVMYETVKLTNFNPHKDQFELTILFDADFQDMFIVRGYQDGKVGKKTGAKQNDTGFEIGYDGEDGIARKLLVEWDEKPARVEITGIGVEVTFNVTLEARDTKSVAFYMMPIIGNRVPVRYPLEFAVEALRASYADWEKGSTKVESDLPMFNSFYDRGLQDIRVLLTDLGYGRFPVAGLPWYAVPFGRDSIIAALQMMSIHPEIAKGTILTMAHFQGEKVDPWRDEQPGKIMHELRSGELAGTGSIPFTPYYGTIDATPLFLVLIGEYVKWTDDSALLEQMIPHIKLALEWIDVYGDRDGSGFVSYFQESEKGIANQGWKDSGNSIVHRSGEYAKSPIALVEVQGYVYQAKLTLSQLFGTLKLKPEATDWSCWSTALKEEAEALRIRFEEKYWMESDQYYALALDEEQKPVETVTSNTGHVLMSGMIRGERAAAVARKLVDKELFSGYGIRTMADGEIAYNPMSYHNGSIWPHDNSVCLMGLNAQGFHKEAVTVMEGLLKAGEYFENNRLPELFCGHSSERGKPVRYPVACSPQAWAAATPLMFVQVLLGMRLDYTKRQIVLEPALPTGMNKLSVSRMRLGDGFMDVEVQRRNEVFTYEVLANTTGWTVLKELSLEHDFPSEEQ
ncbi:amylo-alpha-1,6-glucosidase [Paenibacillus harenae]|uniref:amylo-alpha-1,6-glucosidase n=1 Tax=Paenibacillus harenae TaxID=306543 RepID=UPI00042617B8|nr:amylo-alpha-1,6-glucosidase [Paenibacillus harenae]